MGYEHVEGKPIFIGVPNKKGRKKKFDEATRNAEREFLKAYYSCVTLGLSLNIFVNGAKNPWLTGEVSENQIREISDLEVLPGRQATIITDPNSEEQEIEARLLYLMYFRAIRGNEVSCINMKIPVVSNEEECGEVLKKQLDILKANHKLLLNKYVNEIIPYVTNIIRCDLSNRS